VQQDVPSGASVMQNCGIIPAVRVISGTVTAATETACMDWIKTQRGTGLMATWPTGVTTPTTTYEDPPQINSSWKIIPLTSNPTVRGSGANFQVVETQFRFSQRIPSLSAPF
jgi:hypothetical protein